MLTIDTTESPSRSICVPDEHGSPHEILHITASMRPEKSVHISYDVIDAEAVTANLTAVEGEMYDFIHEVFTRAAGLGLPVPVYGGEDDG